MSDPLVCVVILSWNARDMTLECIDSFQKTLYPNVRFLLVDNGSQDDTPEAVEERFPGVQVVRSPVNRGISGGYNLGIRAALQHRPAYIMVTNNDVEPDPGMLSAAVQTAEAEPDAGMIMPKIYHYYGDRTRLWCVGARWRRFPPGVKMIGVGARDDWRWMQPRVLEFAPSCTLLIRSEVFDTIGAFDEGYFFYNDDWDFSVRLRRAGYRILFAPAAHIWHKVSVSTQKSEKPARWWRTLGSSTVRFYDKYSNRRALFIYVAWFVARETLKLKFSRIPPFLAGVRESTASQVRSSDA